MNEDGGHAITAIHGDVEICQVAYKLFLESEIIGIHIPFLDLAFGIDGYSWLVTCNQHFQTVQSRVVTYGQGISR